MLRLLRESARPASGSPHSRWWRPSSSLFWLAAPAVSRSWAGSTSLIFFVGVAAGCVFAGIPIAFAFGLGTFGYLALATSTPLPVMVGRMDEGMSHLILLSVPMFVFLGC